MHSQSRNSIPFEGEGYHRDAADLSGHDGGCDASGCRCFLKAFGSRKDSHGALLEDERAMFRECMDMLESLRLYVVGWEKDVKRSKVIIDREL